MYKCVEKDEILACEEYTSWDERQVPGAECPKDRCTYHYCPLNLCWPSGSEPSCEYYPAKACTESATCKWKPLGNGYATEGECLSCPAGTDCSEVWNGPDEEACDGDGPRHDTGKACTTYGASNCPNPRCHIQYPDDMGPEGNEFPCGGAEGENAFCREKKCIDLYSEVECRANTACTYDSNYNTCFDANDMSNFPCRQFLYTKESCGAAPFSSVCQWVATHNDEYDDGLCIPKNDTVKCILFSDQGDCLGSDAAKALSCQWHEETYRCLGKGEQAPCGAFYDKDACEAEPTRCKYYDTDGQSFCYDASKEIPCSCHTDRMPCIDSGYCSFDDDPSTNYGERCKECPVTAAGVVCPDAKSCSEYPATGEHCPYERCEVTHNPVTKKLECTEQPCIFAGKDECVSTEIKKDGRGCHWTSFSSYGGDYDYDQGTYNGKCWPDHLPHVCEEADDHEHFCTNTAKLPPPQGWGIECEYKGWKCLEKGETLPCRDIEPYDEATCTVQEDCKWMTDKYSTGECMFDGDVSKDMPDPTDQLDGKGDGTGNEDPKNCDDDQFAKVKAALEEASEQCVEIGRRNRRLQGGDYSDDYSDYAPPEATTGQIKCLEYFLGQIEGSPQSLKDACPCIWLWAREIAEDEYNHQWMLIKC